MVARLLISLYALAVLAFAPTASAAPPGGDGEKPQAVHLLARADVAQDLGYVVLKGDQLQLRRQLAARSIAVVPLVQSPLERTIASGRRFSVDDSDAALATATARAALDRAQLAGHAAIAFLRTGPGPAVALVQGRTGALAALETASGATLLARGSVARTGDGCALDEQLELPPGETLVSALTAAQSRDGCAALVGVTVPLTTPLEIGWATVARVEGALGRVALCTSSGCAGDGYDRVHGANRRLVAELERIERRCKRDAFACADTSLAPRIDGAIRTLDRSVRRAAADCDAATCPSGRTVTRKMLVAGACERLPVHVEKCDGYERWIFEQLDCLDLDCVTDQLPSCEAPCPLYDALDAVLALTRTVPNCRTTECVDDALMEACRDTLDRDEPFFCPGGRPVSGGVDFVVSAIGPELMMQYIAGVLDGDVGTPEGDALADVDADILDKVAGLDDRGPQRIGAGHYRSYYEDPPKIDVTVVQPYVSWSYRGGCIRASEGYTTYDWYGTSGWRKDDSDTMRHHNCGIAYTSSYAHFTNYAFCNPAAPTYNIYNRTMVSGKPDGTLAGQSNPKKAGDCASWLRYRRRLVRTSPYYKCVGDGCSNEMAAARSAIRGEL